MYALVQFELDDSVAIIPEKWLRNQEKTALWPHLRSDKLEKAVKSQKDIQQAWELEEFAVKKILYKTGNRRSMPSESLVDLVISLVRYVACESIEQATCMVYSRGL